MRHAGRLIPVFVLFVVLAAGAPAADFGPISVVDESGDFTPSIHGYREFRFRVVNRGAQQHQVEIAAPAIIYSGQPGTLRRMSRSVTLPPRTESVVTMLQPPINMTGANAEITIDGKVQADKIPLNIGYSGGGGQIHILASRSISEADLRASLETVMRKEELAIETSPRTLAEWSANWLALTRHDAIVLRDAELRDATPPVRLAIERFARAGGTLVVFEATTAPEDCVAIEIRPDTLYRCKEGFGTRFVTTAPEPAPFVATEVGAWVESMRDSFKPFSDPSMAWGGGPYRGGPVPANAFRVVDELTVPVRGLFIAMTLFAIVAGPVNLIILSKKNRRIWVLWTLPLLAIATCVVVIVYASFSEGWMRVVKTEAVTLLDSKTREATTIGWTGYYATVAPSDGLRFGPETELTPFGGARQNELTMDWTRGQQLRQGWLTSRVSSSFRIRKSETRRERIEFRERGGGGLEALNGLGAPIETLWVATPAGELLVAGPIAPGASAALQRSVPGAFAARGEPARNIWTGDWLAAQKNATVSPHAWLEPGRWMATVDGAPFVEDALDGLQTRKQRSLVLGDLEVER
ncbi:MAG: hypothetical protein NDJ92_11850 [Thermoanaerobaculia bacterium]|nr:hypothetical protein [Thermoanaerobaculia bacterium]